MKNIIKILWILTSVGVAIWGIQMGGDSSIVAVYMLSLLTIPSGMVVYFIGSFLLSLLSKVDPNFGITHDIAISVVMHSLTILSGYWQWFILLPKLVEKFKNRKLIKRN